MCVFTSLLIGIGVYFILTTLLYCILGNAQYHIAEAIFATIRDISLATAFIKYLIKIWKVFADPCGSVKFFFCCLKNSKNLREESIAAFINYEPTYGENKIILI